MKKVRAAERGSTLLEFALVIIVLLMMLFGIIDFGRALFAYHFVSNAAREGTRYAIVRGGTCGGQPAPCPASDNNGLAVQKYVKNSAIGLGLTPPFVDANWPGTGSGAMNCQASAKGKFDTPGCIVQVTVQYPFKFIFPLMPKNSCTITSQGLTETGSICMSSTSQMVISH